MKLVAIRDGVRASAPPADEEGCGGIDHVVQSLRAECAIQQLDGRRPARGQILPCFHWILMLTTEGTPQAIQESCRGGMDTVL